MENKRIFIVLFFVLLQATSGKGADPALSFDNRPLNIYVDGGKEIDSFLSLAKKIENTQSRIEGILDRMSTEIKTMAERISAEAKATEERLNQRVTAEAKSTEEKFNQRVTAEAKATEERLNQRVTAEAKATEERLNKRMSAEMEAIEERWNQKLSEMSIQQTKSYSSDVAISNKRPAELACDVISKDLRSSGLADITGNPYYSFWFYKTHNGGPQICNGALIDKRFILTYSDCLFKNTFIEVKIPFTPEHKGIKVIPTIPEHKGIKAIHIHPDYSSETASLHNIGLVELDSDVEYSHGLYPVCLYTTQSNPKSNLILRYTEVQIVADTQCEKKNTTSEVCAQNIELGCSYTGEPIYFGKKEFPKFYLFGIVFKRTCYRKPYVITKVFDHLEFIEGIVWPKKDY